jgi:hypothetical protein
MINPFAGGNPKPIVEVVSPNQPISDRPLLNMNFSGSKLMVAR